MLMRRNANLLCVIVSGKKQEAEKQQKQKVMKILISNQWDDFMETPHDKQFVSAELSLTAY